MRAERFTAVHGHELLVAHFALGETDQQVAAEGGQRDVEGGVTIGVDVHERALALVVPGEVVLVADRDRCPVAGDISDPIRRLRTTIDPVLEPPGGRTTDRDQAQKEPDSQPPPHENGL